MDSTPKTIAFNDGEYVYVRETSRPLVTHWASRHNAQEKVEYISQAGASILEDPSWSPPRSIVPSPEAEYVESHIVQAVPHSTWGAYREAKLVERLLFTESAEDYRETRRNLKQAGYPDSLLDTAPAPE